jgi:hypothetical protein
VYYLVAAPGIKMGAADCGRYGLSAGLTLVEGQATLEFVSCYDCEILNGTYQLEGDRVTFSIPAPTADCYRHRIREIRQRFSSVETYARDFCDGAFCEISLRTVTAKWS